MGWDEVVNSMYARTRGLGKEVRKRGEDKTGGQEMRRHRNPVLLSASFSFLPLSLLLAHTLLDVRLYIYPFKYIYIYIM